MPLIPCQRASFDIPRGRRLFRLRQDVAAEPGGDRGGAARAGAQGASLERAGRAFLRRIGGGAGPVRAADRRRRPDDVAIVPSVSYAMATVMANVPVAAGQKIVTLADDFPSGILAVAGAGAAGGGAGGDGGSAGRRRLERGDPRGDRPRHRAGRRAAHPLGLRNADRRRGDRPALPLGRSGPGARHHPVDRRAAARPRRGRSRLSRRHLLQMAARALQPRLPLRRSAPPAGAAARGGVDRPPQRPRFPQPCPTTRQASRPAPGASTWASAPISRLLPVAGAAIGQLLDWGVANIAETLGAMTAALEARLARAGRDGAAGAGAAFPLGRASPAAFPRGSRKGSPRPTSMSACAATGCGSRRTSTMTRRTWSGCSRRLWPQ